MSDELDLKGAEITLLDEEEEEEEDGEQLDDELVQAVFAGGLLLANLYELSYWAKKGAPSEAHKEHLQEIFDDSVERLRDMSIPLLPPVLFKVVKKYLLELVEREISATDLPARERLEMLRDVMREHL
jgi:hypothetical protein